MDTIILKSEERNEKTKAFIKKAREVHGDKYDYSKVNYVNNKTKVCIICPEHGEFWQTPVNHIYNRHGCPTCREENRFLTKDKFIERAKQIHGDKYDYSKVSYNGMHTPVCIICPEHGEFWQRPSNHLNGHGCNYCGGSNVLLTEEFIKKAGEVHGDKYDYSKVEYKNSHTKVCIICPEHGEFWQTPSDHIRGSNCPKCRIKIDSVKTFIQEAKKVHGDKYDYSKIDKLSSSDKIEIICPLHGSFRQLMYNHLKGCDCPECAKIKYAQNRALTNEEFIQKARNAHGNKYDYSKVNYIKSHEKVCIICPEHGEFWQLPYLHIQGTGCPKCILPNYQSNAEKEIKDYLKSICINDIDVNNRQILQNEIDIYLPLEKLGIEYDGLYWHSEAQGKDKNYHLNKTKECEKQGIRLIHIFEDEWLEHPEIVKSMISNILGHNSNKIYARKCKIKEVPIKECNEFLNNNHIQGSCPSNIKIGLYHNNELVSLMTFGKPRKFIGNKNVGDNDYELIRFCNKLNTSVIGGASKLFKYFIKMFNPDKILTYADKRWSQGKLYKILGFEHTHDSQPNYFYYISGKRKSRFNYRKSELIRKYNCPKEMSEHEFCLSQKWYRIYDCGNMCFEWNKNKICNKEK